MTRAIKTLIHLLILFLLIPDTGNCQRDSFFVIRLGEKEKPSFDSFAYHRQFGIVYANYPKDEPAIIYLGGYTEKAEAERILSKLPENSNDRPTIEYIPFKRKKQMRTIHLALFETGTPIDWKSFFQQGFPVFVVQENDVIRIVAGDFRNERRQQKGLQEIIEKGFVKAYSKSFPEEMVIKIGEFESGNSQEQHLEPSLLPQVESESSEQPPAENMLTILSSSNDEYPPITAGTSHVATIHLQTILKKLGYFKDSIDGNYNRATTEAFLQFSAQNEQWLKYTILGNHWIQSKPYTGGSLTQNAISMLGAQPEIALPILNSTNHPLAIGYLQLHKFQKEGPGTDISLQLTEALKKAAIGKEPDSIFFQKTVALGFENLPDILRGIAFLHQMYPSFKVPCWIFEKYPKISDLAFTPAPAFRNFPYALESCEGFSEWSEIKTIRAMVKDLCLDPEDSLSMLSLLYHTGFIADDSLKTELQKWEEDYMDRVENWTSTNAISQRTGPVFTVAFYQCMLRLESYFLAKNSPPEDALTLARASLRLLVGNTFQPDKT